MTDLDRMFLKYMNRLWVVTKTNSRITLVVYGYDIVTLHFTLDGRYIR